MTDNQIRNEYIKILKTAPSRGGQEAPSWVIDEAKTANIKTIKRKVDAFRRNQKKLSKKKGEMGKRSRKELEKLYIQLSRKHRGESCYKPYGGKLECQKRPDSEFKWDLKIRFKGLKLLEKEVLRLELLDSKTKKKSKKQRGGNNRNNILLKDTDTCYVSFLSRESDKYQNALDNLKNCKKKNKCDELPPEFSKLKEYEQKNLKDCADDNSKCLAELRKKKEWKSLFNNFKQKAKENMEECKVKCKKEQSLADNERKKYEKIEQEDTKFMREFIKRIKQGNLKGKRTKARIELLNRKKSKLNIKNIGRFLENCLNDEYL